MNREEDHDRLRPRHQKLPEMRDDTFIRLASVAVPRCLKQHHRKRKVARL
jgi:hypothetical protein